MRRRDGRAVGVAFALACLTRYEAWPVTAVALAAAAWARWRAGDPLARGASAASLPIAVYPVAAILGFVVFSRVVVGQWFVPSGLLRAREPGARPSLARRVADRLGRRGC